MKKATKVILVLTAILCASTLFSCADAKGQNEKGNNSGVKDVEDAFVYGDDFE